MDRITARPARDSDLDDLPDYMIGQIIDGELIAIRRPPSNPYGIARTAVLSELHAPFHRGEGGPGGWWVLLGLELHFGQDVLVPSVAGWRYERLPEIPDAPYMALAPDWVCEVLSPATASLARGRKKDLYAQAGVGHLWLVDPDALTLEVFQRQDADWVQRGTWSGEERIRAEPFEGIELELEHLWPRELRDP